MEAAPDPLEYELQGEISGIMIQNYVRGLHRDFEMRLWEHQSSVTTFNKARKKLVTEMALLRDELNGVLSVVSSSEPGVHHGSLEKQEDHVMEKAAESSGVMLDIPDFSLLKHMQGEEITNFLKSEWLKLRRQHESELHEKTEELFRVKRESAKEKALLHRRKEGELELVRSKLARIVSRMNEIASVEEDSCFDCNGNDAARRLEGRVDSLLHENDHLRGLLDDKREEVKHLSSRVLDAERKIQQHLNLVEKLRDEVESSKIERYLDNLSDTSIFGELLASCKNQICDMDQELSFVRELLVEKEDELSEVYEDRQKLKIENHQLVSIAESALMKHHEQTSLMEKVCEQELLILESKSESDSMKSCLNEALQQIHTCKLEIQGLTEILASMSVDLEEAKEENALLESTILEMKKAQHIGSHMGLRGHLEFDPAVMVKLSKAYGDFESRIAETMKRNESRLASIIGQFNPLLQQVAVIKKKEFWYQQMLEIKCSNLRKAEAEVDVLADEVETLINVLGKIYIALDHYSPVLKHYPGVTEILMLVQKVLKGENI